MKKYEEYKKINQIWLTSIPVHWQSKKIKYLFSERSEKGFPKEQLLVSSQNMGVVPKNLYGNRTVEAQKDFHLLKLVKEGDFVISLRSFQGGIEYAYYQGIISPAYTIMINNGGISSIYFRYLAKSQRFIELLQMCVTGIREGQNIDYKKLKNFSIPVPSREEQDQIVRFLDWKVSSINKLIKIKKKQIIELKELKRFIINKAVTKGLNQSVSFKDSGYDFIGKIPSHWNLLKLKRLLSSQLQYGANATGMYFNPLLPRYIRITDITMDNKLKDSDKQSLPYDVAKPFLLKDGDILFARSGATVGKSFIYKKEYGQSCFAGYLIRAIINTDKALPDYIYSVTLSKYYELWKDRIFIQSTIQNISAEKYNNLPIPMPPIQEQKSIVEFVKNKTNTIEKAVINIENQTETLTALKTRLISDVVTGKIDVRDIEIPDYEFVAEEQSETSPDTEEEIESEKQ